MNKTMSQAVAAQLEHWARHLRDGVEVQVTPWKPTSDGATQGICFSLGREMITIHYTYLKEEAHIEEIQITAKETT